MRQRPRRTANRGTEESQALDERDEKGDAEPALLSQRAELLWPCSMTRCSSIRGRSYQTGATTQVRATSRRQARHSLRVARVVEEPVDRRPGAAHVGPEGAVLAELVHDARPARGLGEVVGREGSEVARAAHGGEGVARGLRGASRSPPRRGLCRSGRRRRRWTSCARGAGARRRPRSPAEGRAGSSRSPPPSASLGPGSRKKGTSAPIPAATSCRCPESSGCSRSGLARARAAAASALPPPRPAASGMRLRTWARQRGSTPAAVARVASAVRTSVSSVKPSTASASAGSSSTESQRSIRCMTVTISCRPSSRVGPTRSARLIFAARRDPPHGSSLREVEELRR